MRKINLNIIVAVCVLMMTLAVPAGAVTHYVDPNGSADFTRIQAGIDSAFYGDTVEVAAGTYHELITLTNGVAVIGAGAGITIIDGDAGGSVVTSNGCDANTVLEGFTITDGSAANGGGMYNINSSPTVTNCTFSSNTSVDYGGGGGMHNGENSSPTVTNCTFSGNTATTDYGGGGGMSNRNSRPTVTNCTFSSNTAVGFSGGGGMHNGENSSPAVTNCNFSSNTGGYGGGMYNEYCSPTVNNCTFSDNVGTRFGGGMYNVDSSPTVTNCIMWGDSGNEIHNNPFSTPSISYSDIAGCGGSGAGWNGSLGADGGGNIDAEPLFSNAAVGDYSLKSMAGRFIVNQSPMGPVIYAVYDLESSPCIDAGDPASDVGAEPEGNGDRVNIGAYGGTYRASRSSYVEPIEGDVNGDGKVDFRDIAIVAGNWLAGTEPEL